MRRWTITIELTDDVVFSRSSATAGAHETLRHVPGSALRGAVASTLYRSLRPDEAWSIFHSGAVRFGCGMPVTPGSKPAICVPAPSSLHYLKAEGRGAARAGGKDGLFNRIERGRPTGQLEQLRNVWLGPDCAWVEPARRSATRTAIEPGEGRAATGQLFTYEGLCAGQRFAAQVEIDDGVPADLADRVVEALTGEVRLGRSSAADYGRARTNAVEKDPFAPWRKEVSVERGRIVVLCLSDICVTDACGAPARSLEPNQFCLDGGTVDWGSSFLRHRSFAPFNAALRSFETERVVIEQGSVIVFDEAGYAGQSLACVGADRESGYGLSWIAPDWLSSAGLGDIPYCAVEFEEAPRIAAQTVSDSAKAWIESAGKLLARRASQASARDDDLGWAQAAIADLANCYAIAASRAGLRIHDVGPGPAQWGRVLAAANTATDLPGLRRSLFEANGICIRASGSDRDRADAEWSAAIGPGPDGAARTFATWIKASLSNCKSLGSARALAREGLRISKTIQGELEKA